MSRQQDNHRLLEECAVLIPHIENALALLSKFSNVNPVHINRCVENCNASLSTLNKVLRTPSLTTEQKQRCLNIIRQITCLSARFDTLLKQGRGVESNDVISNRVRWGECDAAFKRRLQTGVIINLIHKDIENFLNDAFTLFAEHVKDALNRYGALKVYAVLVVKFIRVFNGEEQIVSKSFIAKTCDIFATTLLGD